MLVTLYTYKLKLTSHKAIGNPHTTLDIYDYTVGYTYYVSIDWFIENYVV